MNPVAQSVSVDSSPAQPSPAQPRQGWVGVFGDSVQRLVKALNGTLQCWDTLTG